VISYIYFVLSAQSIIYSETFYLAMTNLVILEGMVLGAPILFVVANDPTSFMLIRSLLVCIICLAVLLPMFVPNFTKTEDEKARRTVSTTSFTNRSTASGVMQRMPSNFFKAKSFK
jgi:hypothetical protein